MAQVEEWRHVVGFKGLYEVSSLGRVRSLTRSVKNNGGTRVVPGKILVQSEYDGYLYVTIWKRGTRFKRWVHHLVARSFIGPRPRGAHVRHRNGVSTCNHRGNLQYGTPVQNMADKRLHGTVVEGERHPRAKVSTAVVLAIRGIPRKALADYAKAAGLNYGWCLQVQRGDRRANG